MQICFLELYKLSFFPRIVQSMRLVELSPRKVTQNEERPLERGFVSCGRATPSLRTILVTIRMSLCRSASTADYGTKLKLCEALGSVSCCLVFFCGVQICESWLVDKKIIEQSEYTTGKRVTMNTCLKFIITFKQDFITIVPQCDHTEVVT
jgi:hypothetical protein